GVRFQVNSAQSDSPAGCTSRETSASTPGPSRFNPKYTFDSFIAGNSNRLAHAAAMGVAQNPGQSYNPLFIYGGAGLGKTHLLQAIGHMAQTRNQAVLYVSGEQFTNEFINAIRERKTDEFRHKYRSLDMLLIDDIHFISGKESTAESFFHTFNELHNSGRQIVLASDRSPKSMPGFKERLRSRFEWGLTTAIGPPDLETRLKILQAKAKQAGADLLPEVLALIARQTRSNIRELEGSLNRVIAYASLLRVKPTLELANCALKDIATITTEDNHSTPTLIITTVAESFQQTPQDLTGRCRDKETALARQVAMYLLRQQNGCSLTEVGIALGDRNPSTVSHACQKVAFDIEASPLFRRKVRQIQKTVSLKLKGKVFR
ncbi:MAG: chromosomal replication initiator protein DnaA, partial [Dehalococcoidales bacterium]